RRLRRQTRPCRGCLRTRLLSQIPESPPGLFEGGLERHQLVRGGEELRSGEKVTGFRPPSHAGAHPAFELPLSETPGTKLQAPEKVPNLKHQTQKTDAGANRAQVGFGF